MDVRQKPGHMALRKGRVSLAGQIYLITSTTHNRKPRFADFNCAIPVARSFECFAALNSVGLLAWVLMPDHAHWLLQVGHDESLSSLVKRLKSSSARELNRVSMDSGPVWDVGYHDRALRSNEDVRQAARYVIANPVRAGLVKRVGDYPYWNAIWL